ncbi:NUDIX hydrolase [Streptomyces erythrochromogenes]|uniref:NUDIX hydrolase n=1 Tax=Streptomyces erythrochromogenes TaxID=285574 RepID=UPI002255059B|nr:NUDIX domain-containing protein [Streptomyces erythrochromogenes]MCX5583443.1 NUDIX domain-containing protein [Streptomyces erythrochromogenes]
MPPIRSHVRDAVATYLERHPGERGALRDLLTALDAGADPAGRSAVPGRITCSAVVVDRRRRVLHVHHGADGTLRLPGEPVEPDDRTLLAAALRGVREGAGIPPAALCHTAEYRGVPVHIGVRAVGAARGEPARLHYDFRMAFHLADGDADPAPHAEGAALGAGWLPFEEVGSPALRARLLESGLDGRARPVNASALIHDGAGRYLLHLRDDVPDIWEPGAWALLGGGGEPQDASLEDTVRRELREEAGLEPVTVQPYAVEHVIGTDGTTVPVQIFTARWNGDPGALTLAEGIMLAWHEPQTMSRLRMNPSTLDLVRRHAEDHSPEPAPRAGAANAAVPHIVGVHLYLERDGEVLLGLRHPDSAYAASTHHFLAGHCEQESAVSCLVREAREEAGLVVDPADVDLVHLVHVVDRPGARPRMQLVFRARRWLGEPQLLEPDRCVAWTWWPLDALPDPIVPYTRAAVEGIRAGRPYTELGWDGPGSAG